MAIAFVGASKVESTSGNNAVAAITTPTAGNALFCCSTADGVSAGGTLTVSDTLNTWTNDTHGLTAGGAGNEGDSGISSAPNVSGSATTVTVTNTAAAFGVSASVSEFSGLATSSIRDATSPAVKTGTAGTALSSNALTNATANALFIGYLVGNQAGAATFSAGAAGWTFAGGNMQETDGNNYAVWDVGYRIVSSVAAQTDTRTIGTSQDWGGLIAVYKQAAAANLPPGKPLVTPAAVPPHSADNWTYVKPGSNLWLQSQPNPSLPAGQTSVDPPTRQIPGPTFAPGSAIEVVSTAISPQPPGRVSIDPGARAVPGVTFAPGSLIEVVSTAIPKMPPGAQVVTPAALSPHAADNWSLVESAYPEMAAALMPPGQTVVTPGAPRQPDNYGFAPGSFVKSGYQVTVLNDAPISYWRLGELSGTNAQDRMGVRDGVYNLTGVTEGVAGALTGDADTAVTLDGTANAYISLADAAAHNLTGDLSIEAWITTTSNIGYIFAAQGPGTQGYSLSLSGGQLVWNTGSTAVGGPVVNDGLWHHIVATLAGTVVTFFIDGASITPTYTAPVPTSIATQRAIGSNRVLSSNFNGSLDEVALYGKALTAAQVLTHYLAGRPPKPIQGQISIDLPALSPHARDNWSLTQSLYGGMVAAVLPPGVQIVAPAAVAPHAADNWTFAPGSPHELVTQAQAPQPPGAQAIDPPALAPHARDNWSATSSLFPGFASVQPMPSGQQLVVAVPSYLRTDASWAQSFGLPITQPPMGDQSINPAASSPRARDNWSFTSNLFPGMAGPVMLPTGQIVIVPPQKQQAAGENWTFAAGGRLELVSQPQPPLPPGRQITNYVLVWRQAPNYTSVLASPIALNSAVRRDLTVTVGSPEHRWQLSQPQSTWSMEGPAHRWRSGGPGSAWSTHVPEHDWRDQSPQE